jgi:hypothetical protein
MTTTSHRGPAPIDVARPEDDDVRLWSVTTLIDVLDKPALVGWAAKEAATAAVKYLDVWKSIEEASGSAEAMKWIAGARWRSPKGQRKAADLGSDVHAACEHLALHGVRPELGQMLETGRPFDDEVAPLVAQFEDWLERFQPEYQASELTIFSETHGYAGTCDGFLTIDGTRFAFDIKTSREATYASGKVRRPYPESVALQIAAYVHGDFAAVWRPRRFEVQRRRYYALSSLEREMGVPVPEVDHGLAIQVTPEFATAYPVRVDEDVFDAFLTIKDAAAWVMQDSLEVMGDPLVAPGRA